MKIKYSIAALLAVSMLNAADDLGVITVDSTTIDDKFENKKTKVSNTIVINSNEIEKINPQSISDILNQIPGMTVEQSEGDIVKVHIRGIGNEVYMGEDPGVAVVIDGVPVDQSSGKINVDMDNIESIKIIKGGASYLYGNDALAGAVIITTKRPKAKSSSKIEAEAGSFGTKRLAVSTNQGFETGSLRLQATNRDSDGYWDDAYLKHKSINGKYQHYIDESSDLIFGIDYTNRKTGDGSTVTGITNAINDPKSTSQVSYSGYNDSDLIKTFATYSKDFEDESNIMFNAYRYTEDKTNYTSRHSFSKAYHTKFSDQKYIQNGIKSEYRKPQTNYAYMLGIDIQRNSIDSLSYNTDATKVIGTLSSNTNTDEEVNAIYGELKNELSENLTSTLNIRHDSMDYIYVDDINSSRNINQSYKNSSYRVGLNYKINSYTNLYTNISTGFRAPTASDISSNRADGYTHDIKSEETTNYEIGVIGSVSSFKYEASIYQLDRDDYIGYSDGSYSWGEYKDNVGDIRSRGFELGLSSDRKRDLSFNLGYTYLESKFKKNSYKGPYYFGAPLPVQDFAGNYVSRVPKHAANLTLDYRPTNKLTILPELIYHGSYFADEANRYKQDAYKVVNLRANYKINKDLEFFAKIDNLLDKDYYAFVTVGSKADDTMEDATIRVAAPRAYYAGLRYKF